MQRARCEEIHRILNIVLGDQSCPSDWSFRDKDKKFNTFPDLIPLTFAAEYADAKTLSDTVSLINDPRHEYDRLLHREYLGNVVGGRPVRYINLPSDSLKNMRSPRFKPANPSGSAATSASTLIVHRVS